MGGEQAATVLWSVNQEGRRPLPAEEEEPFKSELRATYDREGSPYYATARLWDDGVIDPAETPRLLTLALSATLNAAPPPAGYGVFRM
jgi:3-methylcrotonyl-CoA carboxylase beta subunit